MHTHLLSPLRGYAGPADPRPRAGARGYILAPLRGWRVLRTRDHGLAPVAAFWRASGGWWELRPLGSRGRLPHTSLSSGVSRGVQGRVVLSQPWSESWKKRL